MKLSLFTLLGVALAFLVLILPQAIKAAPTLTTTLKRMASEGKGQRELAQYVFKTQGCKNCHTVGHDGKLGFTAKGKELAKAFTGCIDMLTAMTVIVQVSADNRSSKQAQVASRFEEFGCTACHRVAPGELSLTDLGARLKNLHLGCVDVEKLVADQRSSKH